MIGAPLYAPPPRWLVVARQYEGLAEVPGPLSNERIKSMWLSLKNGAWYWSHYGSNDSALPWCGAAMAYVMRSCGIEYPSLYASARSWLDWGQEFSSPCHGMVVVFGRKGGAHVAIVDGVNEHGMLMCWGANQGDRVSLAAFNRKRALGFRWPPGQPCPINSYLPVLRSDAPTSTNES